jgi:hypothetical protein
MTSRLHTFGVWVRFRSCWTRKTLIETRKTMPCPGSEVRSTTHAVRLGGKRNDCWLVVVCRHSAENSVLKPSK